MVVKIEERKKYYEENKEKLIEAKKKSIPFEIEHLNKMDDLIRQTEDLLNIPVSQRKTFEPVTDKMLLDEFISTIDMLYIDELYGCDTVIAGANIESVLSRIREQDYEQSVMIAIKDGMIIDTLFSKKYAPFECTFMPVDYYMFAQAHNDCVLYSVHNHPIMISAKPSRADKVCGDELIRTYGFIGFGVVTKFDFYNSIA